jgi:long-subunit fatty acid transport protein
MGQNVSDAIRYSYFEYGGTARNVGVGNTMGSIGADLSAIVSNPAGLAMFRRSEYTVTPSLLSSNASSLLRSGRSNSPLTDTRTAFNLHNFGVVFSTKPRSANWVNMNFGIAVNHLANFNRAFNFQGRSQGSISQRFQELANGGEGVSGFETGLADEASSIYDFDPADGIYEVDYDLNPKANLSRGQTLFSRGSLSEVSFSFAGNYNDKFAFGISLGVPMASFSTEKIYTERDDSSAVGGAVPYFRDLSYREQLTTDGTGVNAKIGIMVKPNQILRLSAALHTPTVYALNDNYNYRLENNYYEDRREQGNFLGKEAIREGTFEYTQSTPWRIMLGAGLIVGKSGFLSAEVEQVDYGRNRFGYDEFPEAEDEINDDIRNQLRPVTNVRIGGELVFDALRLRAGYGILPSIFQNDDSRSTVVSAGLGYRRDDYFLDLAYRRSTVTETYYPYLTTNAPLQEVENKYTFGNIVFTLGVKF